MSLLNELKSVNVKKIPNAIQKLIDNGTIQECEEINNIYYITFGFKADNETFYNYDETYDCNFGIEEVASVLYCGGMAIDSDLNVLKGIIYPYYYDYETNSLLFKSSSNLTKTIICGLPQVINKAMNTKLSNWFIKNSFRTFNIVTDKPNAWGCFINKKETYSGRVYVDEKGVSCFDYHCAYNSYYGHIFNYDKHKCTKEIKRYEGTKISSAVLISYISNLINDNLIERKIATRIYCAKVVKNSIKSVEKAIKNTGQILKEELSEIGHTNYNAFKTNEKQLNTIAREIKALI